MREGVGEWQVWLWHGGDAGHSSQRKTAPEQGGAKITTIQALLGHKRLNNTMIYARVHDKTVIEDYFRAMEKIEGEQTAVLEPQPVPETAFALLDKLGQEELSDEQRQILDELRRCLTPE